MQEIYENRKIGLEKTLDWYRKKGYKEAISFDNDLILKKCTALTRYTYHRAIAPMLENINKSILKITVEEINDYQVKLSQNLKAAGLRTKLHPIRRLFKYLAENSKNAQRKHYEEITKVIKLPSVELNPPKDVLTDEEIEQIISAADSNRDKALIALLANTGARIAEICSLKFKNIITIEGKMAIRFEGRTKTKIHDKTIILTYAKPFLENHLNATGISSPESYIFPGYKGRPLNPSTVQYALKQLTQKLKMSKNINPHLFRHSRATKLARMPITPIQAMQVMGWKRMQMWQNYAHPTQNETAKAIAALENGLPVEVKLEERVDFKTNVEKLAVEGSEQIKAVNEIVQYTQNPMVIEFLKAMTTALNQAQPQDIMKALTSLKT